MDPDLLMVVGLVIGVFSVPSILGAFADGRVPRAAAITVLISGGLIALAIRANPNGYAIDQLPDLFVNVIARYVM